MARHREGGRIGGRAGVLWVSTHPRTRGGIGAYVVAMAATPLWARWRVWHLATHVDGGPARKLAVFAVALVRLAGVLGGRRPVLAHVHTASNASFLRKAAVAGVLRLARVPVVLHVHGGGFAAFHTAATRPLRWWIRRTLERAEAVVALSDGWARRLEGIAAGARVVVVPNPVAPAPVASPPGTPVRVLCAGRMSREKGTWDVLAAWDRTERRTARLIVVGDGDLDGARRRSGASVEVRDWQPRERMDELWDSAHVLVLASHAEGQPLVVLEAMARGLCVVATAVGGVPDLVDDGRTGVLVPPRDPDALAAALSDVIGDPARRARLGAAGRERVRAGHDPDAVAARLDALYREVLTGCRSPARRA